MSTGPILPVAPYTPDLPDTPAGGSAVINNVYPRTPTSYGAIGAPVPLTPLGSLVNRCQGAAAYRSPDGDIHRLAGDSTKLYLIEPAIETVWTDASGSSAPYHIDPVEQWQFIYFNGDVFAANINDPLQFIPLDTPPGPPPAYADVGNGAPQARYMTVAQNSFVVLGNTHDSVNGNQPQRIWWSAAGDAHNWPTPGSASAAQLQSGYRDLFGDGGRVQGFANNLVNADAVTFQEYQVRQMIYSGPPQVFAFLPVETAIGTPAPYSIVGYGGIAYYLRQDGFCAFDGTNSVPIGANRVDKTFFKTCALPSQTIGAADPLNRMIWWAYTTMATYPNDKLLGYSWLLDRWCQADIETETIFKFISPGYTLDELYTILGYTIDDLPAPLDSPIWQGGQLLFGTFNSTHTLSFLTGAPLAATIDTMEMQPFEGLRAIVTNSRPLVDFGPGPAPVPTVAIGHRELLQNAAAFTPPVGLNSMGQCPVRTSGRYLRGRIIVPAGQQWTNISGIQLEAARQGRR